MPGWRKSLALCLQRMQDGGKARGERGSEGGGCDLGMDAHGKGSGSMILFLHSLRIYLKTFDQLFKTTKSRCIFFFLKVCFLLEICPVKVLFPIHVRMLVVTSCLLCVQPCLYSEPGLANPSFYSGKVTCLLKGSYQSIIVRNLEAYVPTSCFVFLLLKKSLGY